MSDTKPIEPVEIPDPAIKPPAPIQPPAANGGISGIDGAGLAPGRALQNKDAEPYFLKPVSSSKPMESRPAAREVFSATPLVDGTKIFTELEKVIGSATSTVLLAYWAIDFSTKLVTDSSKTWADLLVSAAARNVKVRVLMNDFDPGLQADQHLAAWFGLAQLLLAGSKAKVSADALQAIVTHHPAEVPALSMGLAAPNLYDNLAVEINKITPDKMRVARYLYSPGLWEKIGIDSSFKAAPTSASQPYPAWPASHHQKIAIVDGKIAFTGGVNLTAQYIDSDKHAKPVDKDGIGPWHDAYVRVEGPEIIRDFVSNYLGLWNQGKASMEAFLKAQSAALKAKQPWYASAAPSELKDSDVPIDTTVPKTTPAAIPAQIRRTVSGPNSTSPFFSAIRQDVLEGYLLAISLAEDYVYIENQYFRDARVGNAIIDRHKKQSRLKAIVVIPSRSEELVRSKGDMVTQYGSALQYEIIDAMQRQMGANLGVFAMERADKAIVYVHSKLLLIDDKLASIGSANTNPRSLSMDTELDLVWYDPTSVLALRKQLWNEMLGKPSGLGAWKPADYVKKWKAIADANKTAKPAKLRGYVRPFQNVKFEKGLLDLGAYS